MANWKAPPPSPRHRPILLDWQLLPRNGWPSSAPARRLHASTANVGLPPRTPPGSARLPSNSTAIKGLQLFRAIAVGQVTDLAVVQLCTLVICTLLLEPINVAPSIHSSALLSSPQAMLSLLSEYVRENRSQSDDNQGVAPFPRRGEPYRCRVSGRLRDPVSALRSTAGSPPPRSASRMRDAIVLPARECFMRSNTKKGSAPCKHGR